VRPTRATRLLLACCLFSWAISLGANEGARAGAGRTLSLDEAMAALDAAAGDRGTFRWDPFFGEGSFAVGGNHGSFAAALAPGEDGFLVLNNRDLHQVHLPFLEGGELVFPEAFVEAARNAFGRAADDVFHYRVAAIVIDPGHGGRDPGAVAEHEINGLRRTVRESDIALTASKMLRDMLARTFPDKRVLMTRETDVYISLANRALFANSVPVRDNEAVVFVSIHANAATNRNARGFEVWHITPTYRRDLLDADQFPDPYLRRILNMLTEEAFFTESVRMAQSILDGLQDAKGAQMPNRGLRAQNWFVVRRSNMPAVLVELGFVSNRQDATLMTNEATLRRMVEGVHRGVVEFVGDFERSGGFTIAQ